MQVINANFLQAKAIDQWTRELPIIASRGKILDRNGEVIVANRSTYTVFLRSKSVTNEVQTASVISKVLGLDENKVLSKCQNKRVSEQTLARQVEKSKIDELLSYNLSGIYYAEDNTRVYKYGDTLTQVLGYVSSDSNGQAGLELYYNDYLKGKNGEVLFQTDLIGVELENTNAKYLSAINGLNLTLTIDLEIQLLTELAMERAKVNQNAKGASCIVMDVTNGEILAMTSKPSYNLNEVPRDDISLLNSMSRNNLVVDVYEPGSTFKIITSCINVEEYLKGNSKAYSPKHIYNSSRYRVIDGQRIKCWSSHDKGKHANLDLCGALNCSCNPIFVDIATSIGKETFYEYLRKFNFGKSTGIDFIGESSGMLLKESVVKPCDLARIGFGQTIAVTGLQLVSAVGAIANGGTYYKPHLVKSITDENGRVAEIINPTSNGRVVSQECSKIMVEMLESVVKDGGGKKAYIEGYRVCGKTGTAQKYENGSIARDKYVSSFIGFFPASSPKYLALVVVDEPQGEIYGSTVAAPYAKEIFDGIISLKY